MFCENAVAIQSDKHVKNYIFYKLQHLIIFSLVVSLQVTKNREETKNSETDELFIL